MQALPRDSERFAEYRPKGFAYDYESGQQHMSKDWRPALQEDAALANARRLLANLPQQQHQAPQPTGLACN